MFLEVRLAKITIFPFAIKNGTRSELQTFRNHYENAAQSDDMNLVRPNVEIQDAPSQRADNCDPTWSRDR